jgi:glycosyltransferase involved in cell wall biosynthesis
VSSIAPHCIDSDEVVGTASRRPCIGYLSGAPRVSTRPDAEAAGPRSHVVGVIDAFRGLGCEVRPYIVGDRMPSRVVTDSRRVLARGLGWRLAGDLSRVGLGLLHARRAWRELGRDVDWVYERFASFQALGRTFQRHGTPWILETQGPFYEEAKHDRRSVALARLARRHELTAYRECDVLVCVSYALRSLLLREAGLAPHKVIVVPNGVDPHLFVPRDPARRTDPRTLAIAYTGSLTAWQSLDVLLRAMGVLASEGVPLSLRVIGDGAMREEWETLARDLGLADRVRFLGKLPHAQVPDILAAADLGFAGHGRNRLGVLYHSPLKIYEYLAMAKPVVASASEDALTAVRDGENGFVYEPGDPADLARALRRAWSRRDHLLAMGARAREEVLARHTWRHRAEHLQREVAAILERRS